MGGIEATQKIREQKRFAALPIIAMTAHAMAEERQKCADAGMQDHITKPIDPDTLYRTLAAWCKTNAASRNDTPMQVGNKQDVEPIPHVEGLDTSAGMKRVAGNRELYLKLLRQFVEGHASTVESIRASLGSGDRKTAERIAHTANGVSGNIGARAVQALAAELELAVAAGNETEALIERFANELAAMLGRLQSALGTMWTEAAVPARAMDTSELKLLLERLARMLAVRDGEALELFLDEEAVLKPALGAGFSAIEEAVKNFDFDEALAMLKDTAVMHSVIL
jgi:CheY-like chemotaxis protein